MANTIPQARVARRALVGLIAGSAVLLISGGLLGDAGAADHARVHSVVAAVSAGVAVAILARWSTVGIAAWAPVAGLAIFAVAQLLEGVGALGYDTAHDLRRDLAVAHDLGTVVSAIGLMAVVFGTSVGLGLASWRGRGPARLVGTAISLVLLAGGGLVVKTLTGL
ncbi:MAG: hypothetical protein NVS9B8_17800 [Candidatus Limnocylindrales bacterium]